jgi:hypothetical protein
MKQKPLTRAQRAMHDARVALPRVTPMVTQHAKYTQACSRDVVYNVDADLPRQVDVLKVSQEDCHAICARRFVEYRVSRVRHAYGKV